MVDFVRYDIAGVDDLKPISKFVFGVSQDEYDEAIAALTLTGTDAILDITGEVLTERSDGYGVNVSSSPPILETLVRIMDGDEVSIFSDGTLQTVAEDLPEGTVITFIYSDGDEDEFDELESIEDLNISTDDPIPFLVRLEPPFPYAPSNFTVVPVNPVT